MHQPIPPQTDLLHKAAEAFTHWRAAKTGRQRIPEHLWDMACQAARDHGVSKTAQMLKLDYYRLQQRIGNGSRQRLDREKATAARRSSRTRRDQRASKPSAAFVELPPITTAANHIECELDFENGQGTRLVLRWKGNSAPDPAEILTHACRKLTVRLKHF